MLQNPELGLVELTPEQVVLSADLTCNGVLRQGQVFLDAVRKAGG